MKNQDQTPIDTKKISDSLKKDLHAYGTTVGILWLFWLIGKCWTSTGGYTVYLAFITIGIGVWLWTRYSEEQKKHN